MKKYTLPKDFAEKWVAALRSGEYNQNKNGGLLVVKREEYEYCCLGVGGVVCGIHEDEMILLSHFTSNQKREGFLFTELVPEEIKYNENVESLAARVSHLNDSGSSFEYIADWIEQHVKFV